MADGYVYVSSYRGCRIAYNDAYGCLSESPAAYKDILVLTKMQIRMAMWDVPLPIKMLQMTPVGTLIGNLY